MEDIVFITGYDAALIGISEKGQAVYSHDLLIEEVMSKNSIDRMDAIDYIDFNISSAYVGEYTPIIVYTIQDKDA